MHQTGNISRPHKEECRLDTEKLMDRTDLNASTRRGGGGGVEHVDLTATTCRLGRQDMSTIQEIHVDWADGTCRLYQKYMSTLPEIHVDFTEIHVDFTENRCRLCRK